MTTVLQVIEDAMLEIGARQAGEATSAQEAEDNLRLLNRMLKSWNTEGALVYTVNRNTYPLIIGKQNYTLGTGGDFNVARPVVIDMVSVLIGSPTVELPIDILNDQEWRDMSVKQVNSSFPLMVWPTGNYPLNELWFWPVPQEVNNIVLYTWNVTAEFTSLTTVIAFPDGYEEAIVSNLALLLCPRYGLQPHPVTVDSAKKSLSRIKKVNWEPTYRSADSVLIGNGSSADIWRKSRGYVLD